MLFNATLSTLISSGIELPLFVSAFISIFISSGIGYDIFYAFISYFGYSFFSAFDFDFPPFIALFLDSGGGTGSFFTGAGDGTVGFFSLVFGLLLGGLLTAEVVTDLASFSLLVCDFFSSPSSFF